MFLTAQAQLPGVIVGSVVVGLYLPGPIADHGEKFDVGGASTLHMSNANRTLNRTLLEGQTRRSCCRFRGNFTRLSNSVGRRTGNPRPQRVQYRNS